MLDFYLIIDLLVITALSTLSYTILRKDGKSNLNRIFALVVVCVSIWIIANYVSNDIDLSPRTVLIANYLVFFFSYASVIFLLKFVIYLASDDTSKRMFGRLQWFLYAVALSGATPLVVSGVSIRDNIFVVHFGVLASLYFVSLIGLAITTTVITYINMKRASGDQYARLQVLFRSLCWTFPIILVLQALIPSVTGWFGLANIGILPMVIPVYGLYYGVVKHRLFDLRTVVFRAAAYSLSTLLLAVLYVAPTVYFLDIIMQVSFTWVRFFSEIILVTIAATNYGRIKKWFDSQTSKIFFRDSYDSAALLGALNRRLVTTTNLSQLLEDSAALVADKIKTDFCVFILKSEQDAKLRIFGTKTNNITAATAVRLYDYMNDAEDYLISIDFLSEPSRYLREELSRDDVAFSIRLTTNDTKKSSLGYMILGYKKSGNPYTSQDFDTLKSVADVMILAIQNALHYEEIQDFTYTLQRKISDATARLQRTNAKLKALDETKDDFISMASHQLRTPLTSVKGYLSMVLEGDAGKLTSMQRKMLDQAFVSSQRMVFLIADLLNVSRLKTGKFVIEPSPVNLAKTVSDEVNQLKETAKNRSLELRYDKPAEFPTLMIDETKIRQVIMNFIDNAIYYTPAGGQIAVELKDTANTVEFRVTDNGIGVPKREQPHLFTKFYRAGNARQARPDGTGLGLFMAKKVVVAQGGAVLFDSKEDKGSTFGFIFPKQKLAVPAILSPILPTAAVPVKHE